MYTLLLVDDEEEVIEVIARKVKWEELGFSVIGHANNGYKALEMLEEVQPDVVMTDIKMPYMDGLKLCGHIKERYPATKILLFTGFDDFEYAKEAVHLEIEEYILKPLNLAEITKVFENLRQKLDQERNEKRNADLLRKYYDESLPLLQANFYSTLIEGRIPEEELYRYMTDYQIRFDGALYCCIVVHTSASQVPAGMDIRLLTISVDRQAGEELQKRWRAKRFTYLGETVMITQLKSEDEISELTDECDRFCKYIDHVMGAKVTVGIGQVCDHVSELAKSYQTAKEAASYRVLYGSNKAINLHEIVPQRKIMMDTNDGSGLLNIFKMICLGNESDIEKAVGNYMKQISNFEPNFLEKWLLKTARMLHSDMADARYHSKKSLIDQAKEYVQQNYQKEELGLDDICRQLGVSNSYFSSMFKKETGKSFVGYLTDYRMEKAARMLVETGEKSYMIAKSVGYSDPNYFSYVFKRSYGVSPSKYRTEYAEN